MRSNGDARDTILSQLGRSRVREIAKEEAEEVDQRNSWVRYRGEWLLSVVRFAFGVQLILSLLAIPIVVVLGWPLLRFLEPAGVAIAALLVLKVVEPHIQNPDMTVGEN